MPALHGQALCQCFVQALVQLDEGAVGELLARFGEGRLGDLLLGQRAGMEGLEEAVQLALDGAFDLVEQEANQRG